jgi:type IV pilus assembly protein PilB
VHAVDSVAAVHRFTDMGIEPFLVASALSGVVGQRLLRRVCSTCAAPYTPTPAEVRIIDEQVGHQPNEWLKGTGCNMCSNTGYRGRVGVYELLQVTDTIRELIVARSTHHELRAAAIGEGMRTMQQQAFELVVDGKTTVEDVIRSVYAPGVDREASDEPKELPAGKGELAAASNDGPATESPGDAIPKGQGDGPSRSGLSGGASRLTLDEPADVGART